MMFDINQYFASDHLRGQLTHSFLFPETVISGVNPFLTPVHVAATLFSGQDRMVHLAYDVTFEMTLPCDRCNVPTTLHETLSFSHILVRTPSQQDDDLVVAVPKGQLDLETVVYTDVMLALPAKFLCREDCKGLCSTCGTNLNEDTCSCETRSIDPRLIKLQQLLENE